MIYELREYHVAPGVLPIVAEGFEKITSRVFEKHGIRNVGYWLPVIAESNNTFTYMIAHEDLAHREKSWPAFTADPEQVKKMQDDAKDSAKVLRVGNIFLRPTPYSPDPLSEAVRNGDKAVVELRIYDITPSKAQAVHDRFTNVTMRLFAKHGMTNIGYWSPVAGPSASRLYYMLGFKSLAHWESAKRAFGADPEWQAAVRATLQNHGTVVDNISNRIMRPTTFSPLR